MPKPIDFIFVGPFKTGTSWIYNYFVNYQQLAIPTTVKETFFFDKRFERGLDWYYSHFVEIKPEQKVGEIAPSYFHSLEAPQRIYQHNPNCQIIVTLREPVSRLVSFYLHMKQRGEIKPQTSFTEALAKGKTLQNTAKYYLNLSRWIDVFGADKVQVIFFEDLKESPENYARQLCNILDILPEEDKAENLAAKVNASQVPVNHSLSRLIYSSVNLLHNLGLHEVVNYGKNIGIKQLLTRKNGKKFQLTDYEFISTLNLFKDDIMMLERELDLNLSGWKEIWLEKGVRIN